MSSGASDTPSPACTSRFSNGTVQLAPHQFGHGGQVGVGRAGVADTVEVASQGEIICVHGGVFLQRVA